MLAKIIEWLSHRSLRTLHSWGAAVGWLSYALSPTYRRRFDDHVAQAGIDRRVARAAIAEAGRLLMELPYLWMRPHDEPIRPALTVDGEAFVEAAHSKRRGVVFLTPHMGSFEVTAQAYAERFGARHPVTVLYRPARKPWLRDLVDTSRTRPGLQVAPATLTGVRQMIRALRRGEAVGLLPDQVPPDGMGVWAPFFGRPAYTMTLAARLVQQTGATLLLTWGERLPRGRGYAVRFSAFDEALPADQTECAAVINRAMERLIMQCPQQYLWGYERYKAPRTTTVGDTGAAHDKD
jgi:KDO2-lipid IV(A) lauroyltransferase